MRIFILEDLPERQKAFRKKFIGSEIRLVDNVKDALELLSTQRFDLVILDHDLEGKAFVDINYSNCGSRVAEYLAGIDYTGPVITGSLNPEGAANILKFLPSAKHIPFYWQTKEDVDFLEKLSGTSVTYKEKTVYKDHKENNRRIAEVIRSFKEPKKILIVFWHGVGDLLMFLPLMDHIRRLFHTHTFDLAILPGVGQRALVPEALELVEQDFVLNHDVAFVLSFPMVEGGANPMTKAEYCCIDEFGIDRVYFGLPSLSGTYPNKMVGVHFQGTCLPGSTNPDDDLAMQIWNDLLEAGYIPIDLHFLHIFHNPANKPFSWTNRNCRDLKPDLDILRMVIDRCFACIGVASGPFVVASAMKPDKTIFLQKHHLVECYLRDFKNVIDIKNYVKEDLLGMLKGMEE